MQSQNDIEYRLVKNSEELWLKDKMFISTIKDYVSLDNPGEYLFYDANNAIHIKTDFGVRLEVLRHEPGLHKFFNRTVLLFNDSGIIVFDVPIVEERSHKTVYEKLDLVKGPIRRERMSNFCGVFSCLSEPSQSCPEDSDITDVILSKYVRPQKIKQSFCGYPIGGYYIRVIKGSSGSIISHMVYHVSGEETQEQLVKIMYP